MKQYVTNQKDFLEAVKLANKKDIIIFDEQNKFDELDKYYEEIDSFLKDINKNKNSFKKSSKLDYKEV